MTPPRGVENAAPYKIRTDDYVIRRGGIYAARAAFRLPQRSTGEPCSPLQSLRHAFRFFLKISRYIPYAANPATLTMADAFSPDVW